MKLIFFALILASVALTLLAESDSAGFITTTALSFFAITVVIFRVDLQEASIPSNPNSIKNVLM